MEPIAATVNDFDASIELLNLRNFTINLTTFEVRPQEPGDMITLSCNANYNPEAICPNFLKYIRSVIPNEELREYVQRALGYSLLGRPTERAMFLLHGPSGTGKSVLTDIMAYVFGDYGVTAPSSTFKQKKQEGGTFDLHRLRGKRFVTLSEMPEGAQLDEELVKRITGGDKVPSRGLYESYQEWRPRCAIWIATNFLPRLSSDDNAIWRRVRTIPMKTEIKSSEEIKGLSELLYSESDGIFNWLLEGLQEYRRIGLSEPRVVLDDISSYRTEIDSVSSWLGASIEDGTWVIDPKAQTMLMQAYNSYVTNCQDNSISHLGKLRFVKRIPGINADLSIKKSGGQSFIVGLRQGTGK